MEKKEFTKELLKIAFAATVCDGEVDASELDAIKTIEKEDFYLKEFDLSDELDQLNSSAQTDYLGYANKALNEASKIEFTPAEKMVTINLAIAIVRADDVVQEREIEFINSLMLNLKIPQAMVEAANPNWWIIVNDKTDL